MNSPTVVGGHDLDQLEFAVRAPDGQRACIASGLTGSFPGTAAASGGTIAPTRANTGMSESTVHHQHPIAGIAPVGADVDPTYPAAARRLIGSADVVIGATIDGVRNRYWTHPAAAGCVQYIGRTSGVP